MINTYVSLNIMLVTTLREEVKSSVDCLKHFKAYLI